MRFCRSVGLLGLLAALGVVGASAHAAPPPGAGAGKVVPFVSSGGVSADDVIIASFIPSYTGESVPACRLLGGDRVLFAQPESTCTVESGTTVIVPLPGATCSDAEKSPYYGATEAEQRACALEANQAVLGLKVSVDGGPPQDVSGDRFLHITDQFSVVSQPGNPFDARPGPTTLVAVGSLGALRGLPPGRHTFEVFVLVSGGVVTEHWTINVVPGATMTGE